jgi:hypothetical protein
MPTHAHLLFTPLRDEEGRPFMLAKITNGIKGASSHSINKLLKRKGHVGNESFDHVIRSDPEFEDTLLYILTNRVGAGLCKFPDQYPWLWRE